MENRRGSRRAASSNLGKSKISTSKKTTKSYPDLDKLERQLTDSVDSDFFQDPKTFRTLHRVVDVLGAQLLDHDNHSNNSNRGYFGNNNSWNIHNNGTTNNNSGSDNFENLHKNNPAYRSLRKQQSIVESAIEHLSIHHCSDLNSSVVAVGKVSKQFGEAVGQVRGLRRQVRQIRENLANASSSAMVDASLSTNKDNGATGGNGSNENNANDPSSATETAAQSNLQPQGKSLRELWLKKLECEAVLNLLRKLEIVRDAPLHFDVLIGATSLAPTSNPNSNNSAMSVSSTLQPCRIGAAVVLLSNALSIMFSDDVAQISALHKIMEQLMLRKQRAEEILWDALLDVLYLRTGNGIVDGAVEDGAAGDTNMMDKNDGAGMNKNSSQIANSDNNSTGGNSNSGSLTNPNHHPSHKRRHNHRNGLHPGTSSHHHRKHRFVSSYSFTKANRNNVDSLSVDIDSDSSDDDSNSIFSDEFSSRSNNNSNDSSGGAASKSGGYHHRHKSTPQTKNSLRTIHDSAVDGNSSMDYDHHHHSNPSRLIPRTIVDSEIDLEVDELRCLETWSSSLPFSSSKSMMVINENGNASSSQPQYTDPVLALRILIEALAKLNRLDDVERNVAENVERELRRIAQLEQAKTFARLEKLRTGGASGSGGGRGAGRRGTLQNSGAGALGGGGVSGSGASGIGGVSGHHNEGSLAEEKLKEFRIHLKSLLTNFGSVMLRLSQLAQILRHRIVSDPKVVTPSYSIPSSALHSVLVTAHVTMQREVKGFLKGCLNEDEELASRFQHMRMVTPSMMDASISNRSVRNVATVAGASTPEQSIFSLGIINDASLASSVREKYAQTLSSASRSNVMEMSAEEYVQNVLCPRTGTVPQVRHALVFRKSIATWTHECIDLKKELAIFTKEDTSSPSYNATTEETAIGYLDGVIKQTLLPVMQDAAVNGTVSALEKRDAFEPILGNGIYSRALNNVQADVEICIACKALYNSTGPLFSALHKLPRGGEMYSPLVAVLEHAILTFISRVKQRVLYLCKGKKAFLLLETEHNKINTPLSSDVELKKPFMQLLTSYFDDDDVGMTAAVDSPTRGSSIKPLAPSASDTKTRIGSGGGSSNDSQQASSLGSGLDLGTGLQREQEAFEREVSHLQDILKFTDTDFGKDFDVCNEDELMKAASLAHSLLKVSSLLERRLKPKKATWGKSMNAPRALRDPIKAIRTHGLRMAKFCRIEMLIQTVKRMSIIWRSSSLNSKDAVRLPSCVNDLGEYLGSTSDLLREAGGNIITAYTLSSLEQYIPLFLMQNVRIIAMGEAYADSFKITLNGIEALDRSCSVLYRDLKSATSFDNSFWDDEVAADAFERAASYVSMMELDMEELVSYCRNNRSEFTDNDYKIMFAMNGPRRKPDISRYAVLKDRMMT